VRKEEKEVSKREKPDEDKHRASLGKQMLVPQGLIYSPRKMGRKKEAF